MVCAIVAVGGSIALIRAYRQPPPVATPRAARPAEHVTPPPARPATLVASAPAPRQTRVHELLSKLTAKYPFGRPRQNALRSVIGYLSAAEVRAALDETFGHDEDNDLTHVLLERLATLDANAALEFAHAHRFGVDPPWWLSVIGGLPQPQLALPDLLQLPAGDARTSFLSYAAGSWAAHDPAAALDYALNAAPAEARPLVLANVILFTAHQDHAAGFALALQYDTQINDPAFLQQVATDWAARDFAGALERVRTLPDSDAQQRALRGVAAVAASRDGESARILIAQVDDSAARAELYRQAAMQWLHRDPNAARAWLTTTTVLSDAAKQSILASGNSARPVATTP